MARTLLLAMQLAIATLRTEQRDDRDFIQESSELLVQSCIDVLLMPHSIKGKTIATAFPHLRLVQKPICIYTVVLGSICDKCQQVILRS